MSAYTLTVGNPLNAFLINRLFKRNKVSQNSDQTNYQSIKDRIRFKMLSFTCLRERKERRLLSKGLNRTDEILEIDRFLKTSMQVQIALRAIFSKTERFLIHNN